MGASQIEQYKKIDALLIKNQKADRSTNLCHCKSRFILSAFLCKYNSFGG